MPLETKPCPECGGQAKKFDCGYTTFDPTWVECQNCHLRSDGGITAWNDMVTALTSKRVIAKSKRRLSDALARMYTEEQLWNILKGRTLDGERSVRSYG